MELSAVHVESSTVHVESSTSRTDSSAFHADSDRVWPVSGCAVHFLSSFPGSVRNFLEICFNLAFDNTETLLRKGVSFFFVFSGVEMRWNCRKSVEDCFENTSANLQPS